MYENMNIIIRYWNLKRQVDILELKTILVIKNSDELNSRQEISSSPINPWFCFWWFSYPQSNSNVV